jgi:hypothetical protein
MYDPVTPIAVIVSTFFLIILLISKNVRPGLRFLLVVLITLGVGSLVFYRNILTDQQRKDLAIAYAEIVEGTPPPIDYDAMARRCSRLIGSRTGADVSAYFNLSQAERKEDPRAWQFVWSIPPGTRQKIDPGRYVCSGDGSGMRALDLDGRSLL